MGQIRVLDDRLIDRIAAGEVVERPASIVKELVENSLDAGARSIEVTLAGGGVKLIRVADDGCGMDREDARTSLERHATSKLRETEDLGAIATLGFRGEALSSIAAVSRFRLSSSVEDGAGTEIEVQGGEIRDVRDVGRPRGTTMEIERLFYNVPARKKFLRTEATELSHIVRLVTRYALAYPAIRFRLEQGGRELLRTDPCDRLEERIAQIYGREFVERLLPFDYSDGVNRAHGYAGRPVEGTSRRDGQHFFVNGRSVQDRTLMHAVGAAYGNTMPRGRFPAMFLLVDVDPADVDVNVHPQKTEVRFRQSSQIHDLVRRAVSSSLSHDSAVPDLADLRPEGKSEELSGVLRAAKRYLDVRDSAPSASGWQGGAVEGRTRGDAPPPAAVQSGWIDAAQEEAEEAPARRAVPLAQYRDSYVVAQDEQGILLVDQHAAHERVLFERYMEDAEQDRVEVQRLMFPLTLELTPDERVLLEEEADEFRRLGFQFEPFGGETYRLDAVPAVAGDLDPAQLVAELIGEAREARSATLDVAQLRRQLITSAACQAAIKVNYPLTRDTMQRLLDDLFRTENPTSCPHGRPALFRLGLDEIERAFGRR
ncbi:MAG: DNA mismatch repair endonuclease MutL [bacterium]|nr:DNA mismatch repair endonuclease MutL [bacterium]